RRASLGGGRYIGRGAGENNETSFGENTGLTAIRIGQLTVPTDAAGRVWLHYPPPQRNRLVSAAAILGGNFDRTLFADQIVLVGTSAKGVVNDERATPLG